MNEKCVTLYKYVNPKRVADIICRKSIYLDDGSNFNDPFELTVTDRSTNSANRLEGLHILCLTNGYKNKLMWSHYTDSHKGVCLTLQIPAKYVYPVCYTSERVYSDSILDDILSRGTIKGKKNISNSFTDLSDRKKISLIKDRKWIYEREYRVVFDQNEETFLENRDNEWYMPVKVINIYLGARFDEIASETKNEILKACENNKVRIAKMELSTDKYALEISRE